MPDPAASITPDSKLGELLERWPTLEEALFRLSPHFRALENPVLRRTVARIATLRQVSKVSGVPLGRLIDHVRAAAGLAPLGTADEGAPAAAEPRPDWASHVLATRSRDAREAIANGQHPMPEVMRDLSQLHAGEVYELVTPFVPAPLIDMAGAKGFSAHAVTEGPEQVRTYFRRA
jgi:Domain of unknown function (DUF1858)/Uncharacterized conserved protein (DUF2249)